MGYSEVNRSSSPKMRDPDVQQVLPPEDGGFKGLPVRLGERYLKFPYLLFI